MKKLTTWLCSIKTQPRLAWVIQFIKFGIVGVSNTVISLGIYYLCVLCFNMHYQLANLLGFFLGSINSYYWNSRYVFKVRAQDLKTHLVLFSKTVAGYSGAYFLGVILLWLWIDMLHISDRIAPLINICITVPLNFIAQKFWTYRKK